MTDCAPCAHRHTTGWWGNTPVGRQLHHCERCHRTWTAKREAHCVSCCQHFGGDAGFDLHRRGGKCSDPRALVGKKGKRAGEPMLVQDDKGIWRNPLPVNLP